MGRVSTAEAERKRTVLIEMRKAGKNPEEIAKVLNYKVNTVAQLIRRAGMSCVDESRRPKKYNYSGVVENRVGGMSIAEISAVSEIPVRNVKKYLRDHGAFHEEDLSELRAAALKNENIAELRHAKTVSIGKVKVGGKVWSDVTDALFETPDDIFQGI